MAARFNPLDYPTIFTPYERAPGYSAWREHVPFAKFLVEVLRPAAIVELGAHTGISYCAWCQAVQELSLSTQCYAVDTWQGDTQAGLYSSEVLDDLRAYHDPRYASFSRLMQTTFDEALGHFADNTIDLLHIDGFHTYEAVKHDFETWLPKMSARGVILFHDITETELDFGVWKFWDEIKASHPHFEMLHGHGLGVLAVGPEQPQAFVDFLNTSPEETARIRLFFARLGNELTILSQKHLADQQLAQVTGSRDWRALQMLRRLRHRAATLSKNAIRKVAAKS